ncbi:lysylphosphatidylglycerol synthase transmembrane domain-containing protein [Trichlorobacter ammonificans]|uniref:Uncharacterized protein n=1 Tax=Trichlorobacter ammonificans TaxID=2916410 RepID=A0ABN8HKF8_9BACT|nr:lysylphosphatidylglycerol synthase transmembrane domain-containing protein [Trichlorobacter ammonificans]CAH2031536.1 conserved membrane protein of unknown function [Trichlorobacter ammonificans]
MKRSRLMVWLGCGVSLLFLVLILRKVDGRQLLDALGRLHPGYLLAALVSTFASFGLRAVRWRYLLIHERPISLGSLYPAVIIGYMANNLFPARLGEFIRAWVLAERERLQTAAVFASLVIDRLFDGLSVMVMLAAVLLVLELPPGMEQTTALLHAGGVSMLLFYALALGFLVALKWRPVKTLSLLARLLKPFPAALSEKVISLCGSFLQGLKVSGHAGHLLVLAASSLGIWLTATLPIHLVLVGFGIHLPPIASFFIMVLLVFAVMVPAAPGYIGTYHLACYTGLVAFAVQPTEAVAISLVIHGIGFFPVILAGLYHLWTSGLSLSHVRRQAEAEQPPS